MHPRRYLHGVCFEPVVIPVNTATFRKLTVFGRSCLADSGTNIARLIFSYLFILSVKSLDRSETRMLKFIVSLHYIIAHRQFFSPLRVFPNNWLILYRIF